MENKPILREKMRQKVLEKEISEGIQKTLQVPFPKQSCYICHVKMPKDAFVTPDGEISVACRGCRTGEIR